MLKHLNVGLVSFKHSFWLLKVLSGVDYCDVLSDVWTLILTAPIHCRASIDEQVMEVLDDLWQYGTFKLLHIAPLAHLTPIRKCKRDVSPQSKSCLLEICLCFVFTNALSFLWPFDKSLYLDPTCVLNHRETFKTSSIKSPQMLQMVLGQCVTVCVAFNDFVREWDVHAAKHVYRPWLSI